MSWPLLGPAAVHPNPNKIRGGLPEITPEDVRLALGGLGQLPFLFGMAAFLGHRGSMEAVEVALEHALMDLAGARRWGAGRDAKGRATGELTREDVHTLERMAHLMLFEVISARSRHDTYAHEQALPTGAAAVLCPACHGRGDRARAATAQELGELHLVLEEAVRMSREGVRRALTAARAWPITETCQLCHGRGRFLLTERRRALMVGVSRPTWYHRWQARYAEGLAIPQRWEAIAIGHVRRKLRRDA